MSPNKIPSDKRKEKDARTISNNEDHEMVRGFESLRDEGDHFLHVQKFVKAIECYTWALELQPDHEHCLVARSRCYLFEGQMDKALADAEASLANNSKNPKGLFQKAEVYYFQSEFEKALVLYHRGHKWRPEMEAFRLGIQKSEEAINNSVGDPETIKLRLDCDLSYFFLNDEKKTIKKKNEGVMKKKQTQEKKTKLERKPCNTDSKTVKQLLGELYADREFLEKLLNEEEALVNKTENSEQIRHLIVKGLNYLDERSDFWQQQKPMYARKKFQLKKSKRNSINGTKQQRDIIHYVVSSLDEIDNKQAQNEHKKAIRQAEHLIRQIDKWTETDLPDRLDILANLYCLIGNSYLDMEDYERALLYHEMDKDLGNKHNIEESLSRSIDNIGRVYAKQKQYNKAIDIWCEKISISKSALESTWLHHEMGRCYLELGHYEKAIEYGEKSIDFAREADDNTWQMNASILVAQAAMKDKKYDLSLEHFDKALDYSKMMKNCGAEEAIKRAINEVNEQIVNDYSENHSKETTTNHKEDMLINYKTENKSESDHQTTHNSAENEEIKVETREYVSTEREASPIKEEVTVTTQEKNVVKMEINSETEEAVISENVEHTSRTQEILGNSTANEDTDLVESPKDDYKDDFQSKTENNTTSESVVEENVIIESNEVQMTDQIEQKPGTPLEEVSIA